MSSSTPHVAVVGGGLSGLTAALELRARGARVTVLEASGRWGGQLHTLHPEAGLIVEQGAEGFVARSEAVPALCARVGLGDQLVDQRTTLSLALEDGALVALADGEAARRLGFQVPVSERGRGIRSLRGGMGQLTGALLAALTDPDAALAGPPAALRLEAAVATLTAADAGVILDVRGPERYDGALLALSARDAAALIAPLLEPPTAAALTDAPTTSSLSMNLVYQRADVGHDLAASGFIVPEAAQAERGGLRACAFSSTKLPGRAPDDVALLRAFFRPAPADARQPDEVWVARARVTLAQALTISGPPRGVWVARWPDVLPVHTEAHRATVAAADAALIDTPVRLAGAAFHGAGIDAAVRSALAAADALLLALDAAG